MKLQEIRTMFVQTFFNDQLDGVPETQIGPVIDNLLEHLGETVVDALAEEADESSSMNVSKAFSRFTSTRSSILQIIQDDGDQQLVSFIAARSGKNVFIENLTQLTHEPIPSTLLEVKQILAQAKNLSDETRFIVQCSPI